ncbi:DUF559 domain-containing protein [Microbacterium sp. KSW4-16]|uniref:DUF559 domain-containing protein n=1 Tax=Microbacterium aurugineum TaxID=2851642 RepID=UPI0020C0D81E|nr:DUF559 domain-containing protein [Microbacterium aurugineum]MCK8468669.1 DUF559 domain-containing protein [Microbacterium aurugineum]
MGRTRDPLPPNLGDSFSLRAAYRAGVGRGRLSADDLERPFPAVRRRLPPDRSEQPDPYRRQRDARVTAARAYAHRMHERQHISHESAAALWGAPLPLTRTLEGAIAEADALGVHVTTIGTGPLSRVRGVVRHRGKEDRTATTNLEGIRLSDPATTWAALGRLPIFDLVALGDYFCRAWRSGHGRPTPGRAPLTTIAELEAALSTGRRVGIRNLREALPLIREDSWSPRESRVRCLLVQAGLPEPELNVDIFEDGVFLACGDLVYRRHRVLIEYHGMMHGAQWAADVERAAALRAAGWTVIEVTAPLLAQPEVLVRRVRAALRSGRGMAPN